MSNVFAFESRKQRHIRWSPLPHDAYSFVMRASIEGEPRIALLETPCGHYAELADVPTWNLMWALSAPVAGVKAQKPTELPHSALNPRPRDVRDMTEAMVDGQRVRDRMLELGPRDMVKWLFEHDDLIAPFMVHKRRKASALALALDRIGHLDTTLPQAHPN